MVVVVRGVQIYWEKPWEEEDEGQKDMEKIHDLVSPPSRSRLREGDLALASGTAGSSREAVMLEQAPFPGGYKFLGLELHRAGPWFPAGRAQPHVLDSAGRRDNG